MQPFDVMTPKHHIIWHLLLNTGHQGNPAYYATWFDEALNKVLKQSCRQTSQLNFEASVLMRMREILKGGRSQKRERE
jgi:hypothetical protein